MKPKYDTVFFDLDGTLTQSEDGITRSVQEAARQLGWPELDMETLRSFIGPPLYYSFRETLGMSDSQALEAQNLYRARYDKVGWKENRVYAGIPRLLRSLRKYGIKTGVTTGKPQKFAERICRYFGLSDCLDTIIGVELGSTTADKAALVSEGMKRLPGKAVVVGDRKFDAEGALANGIDCIGVSYGYGTKEELLDAGAASVTDSVRELQQLLLEDAEPARGPFISLEGMDGCGKTTQRSAMLSFLQDRGWEITVTREPGGDEIAEKIRNIILDPANTEMTCETEAYLYAASRAQNVRKIILPALNDGRLVLCDRFVDSSAAYQGGGRQLGMEQVLLLNQLAVGGCMPDITVYLEMPAEAALARRLDASEPDRLEREKTSFWLRCAETYTKLYRNADRVLTVNAAGTIEEVTAEIQEGLVSRLSALKI